MVQSTRRHHGQDGVEARTVSVIGEVWVHEEEERFKSARTGEIMERQSVLGLGVPLQLLR